MAMPAAENGSLILEGLNCEQRQAVQHGDRPLLIVAGAGTGKTKTLVHRVAHQIQQGIAPGRILLLTFTRRAAAEMLRRVDGLLRQLHGNGRQPGGGSHIQAVWGGTFHAIAARLLRLYAPAAGLEPAFTILDRGDSEDLLDVVRTELGLSKTDQRFPRKGTCLAIYSHCVNAQQPLEDVLTAQFPWCRDCAADLKRLFASYGERKEQGGESIHGQQRRLRRPDLVRAVRAPLGAVTGDNLHPRRIRGASHQRSAWSRGSSGPSIARNSTLPASRS